MKEIIKRDIPFRNISVDRNDAIEYSKSVEENEKVHRLIAYEIFGRF